VQCIHAKVEDQRQSEQYIALEEAGIADANAEVFFLQLAGESLFYFEYNRSLIVENFCPGGELISRFKNSVHNFSRGAACVFGDDVFDAAAAKGFIFKVAGVNNAIAKKSEYVTRLGVDRDFVMGDIFKHAQWKACSLKHVSVAIMAINGARIS
jgi:hypothetical protein